MTESDHEEEIDLFQYWDVIRRRKKLIAIIVAASVFAAVIISLLLPKYYRSEAVIVAMDSTSAGGLGAALSSVPLTGLLAGAAGLSTPADKVMVFLNSRTIAEKVIARFHLAQVFFDDDWDAGKKAWKDPENPPFIEDVLKQLDNITNIQKSKEGAVTIQVEWKDRKLASDIANYYVTALAEILNDKAINTTIQIVDRAAPAEKKSRPKRALIAALAGVMSMFIGVFAAFFLESPARRKKA